MKLALTLHAGDSADLAAAQIAYHLNAGVDVIVAAHARSDEVMELLESYARDGYVQLLPDPADPRLAAIEAGADWLLSSGPGEFWWPRAESLKDVLVPIPPRYTIVQALVREFVRSSDGETFADRMIARPSLRSGDAMVTLSDALRSAARADSRAREVPLRGWYPFELFRFPHPDDHPDEAAVARGLADGSLVTDTRLRDALAALRASSTNDSPRQFALPENGVTRLKLRAPDIVDDAAYAVECAAVGEVDIASIERHIDALESRIAWLEQRFWSRVLRRLSRIGRRQAP
jgi:hypothetical protein